MKKAILFFLLIQSFSSVAQIRIGDFKQSYTDGAATDIRTAREDPDGNLCAVLKLETKQTGWTFDTGFAGIMDTRYEDGVICLYVPASARKLTVAHKLFGILREWTFPIPLEPGRTYTMKLSYESPRQVTTIHTASPVPVSRQTAKPEPAARPCSPSWPVSADKWSEFFTPDRGERGFSDHFVNFYMGMDCSNDSYFAIDGENYYGLSYTWIGNRVGPYISLASDLDECWSIIGGAAYRITDPSTATLDWQVYGGVGLIDRSFGFDVGTRFAWRSSHKVSHWDFGLGCQFYSGNVMPTVSLGLYIWGIPVLICVGLLAEAIEF